LGDFNAKVGREDIFKATMGNESSREINDDGVTVVNFTTSKNPVVKSTMFPHCSLHENTWTCPDRKTHNRIHFVFVDERRHSNTVGVRSFRGAGRDTGGCKSQRLSVSKRAAQTFYMERFTLRKLNSEKVKEQYQVKI
jgi:hypothetical protein